MRPHAIRELVRNATTAGSYSHEASKLFHIMIEVIERRGKYTYDSLQSIDPRIIHVMEQGLTAAMHYSLQRH